MTLASQPEATPRSTTQLSGGMPCSRSTSGRAVRTIPHRPPHERALAEQGLDVVYGECRGAIVHIEGGIQLDHIERGEAMRVGDHLHAQLRLAIGGTTEYARADSRRDLRVQKIDIEADVQVGVAIEAAECLFHSLSHAHLVDVAHVEHVQPLLVHEALLARIDAAHADLFHPRGIDRRDVAADADELRGTEATEAGDRHAVHIAARGELARVEVRVGIEPQHAQFAALLAAVLCDGADRADAEAVVSAEQDRQAALLQLAVHALVHQLVPTHYFRQMTVAT